MSVNLHAQNLNNVDFEATAPGSYTSANAVSGWTVSSQTVTSCVTSTVWTPGSPEFSIVATPFFNPPNFYYINLNFLPQSPLGGTNIAQLNNYTSNSNRTKIAQNYSVTSANFLFLLSTSAFIESEHVCCEQAQFEILIKDCSGNTLPQSFTKMPNTGGCSSQNGNQFSYSWNYCWTIWETFYFDFSNYIGSCVTVEIISSDCTNGCHFGSLFVDAGTGSNSVFINTPGPIINQPNAVNYCPGGGGASIFAPLGYSYYSWIGPNSPIPFYSSTLNTVSLASAIANSVYTVNLTSYSGYTSSLTYTIASSSASIVSIGSSPSCPLLGSGSASVIASGGNLNYTYAWYNSQGQLVSNSQNASGLTAGNYSVTVTSVNGNCGSASANVAVGSTTVSNISYVIQPYCQNQSAYLFASATGSNYQWYNDTSPIAGNQGGNAANYTVPSGSIGAVYPVSCTNANGCKDSVRFYLNPTLPGALSITSNSIICQNSSNGVITLSLNPASNSPAGSISYSVLSLPGLNTFSSSSAPSAITAYTFNSLQAGVNYSLTMSDGLCSYNRTISPNVYVTPAFGLSSTFYTLCPGQYALAQANFPYQLPPAQSQLSFSWSPTIFLSNYLNNFAAQITPTIPAGTSSTIIYTLTATNFNNNCPPSTNTLMITAINISYPTPTISPVPSFCANSPSFNVVAIPPGGLFYTLFGTFTANVINPSLYPPGPQAFTYGFSNFCESAYSTANFTVNALPNLSITGNTNICIGETVSLTVSGASNYTWSNGSTSTSLALSPATTTVFTVTGLSSASCSNTTGISLMVNPLPTVTAIGNKTICEGESTTLTGVGANFYYSWSTGSTANSIVVSPGITTNYTLMGGNSTLCKDTSVITVTVKKCLDTGLDGLFKNNIGINAFPNPNKGLFYIECETKTSVSLYDAIGRLVFENKLPAGKHSIDINSQPNGIYFLTYDTAIINKSIKLVKN